MLIGFCSCIPACLAFHASGLFAIFGQCLSNIQDDRVPIKRNTMFHITLQPVFSLQAAVVTSEEVGDDFEHVEAQKKKFDDYQKVKRTFVAIQICELRIRNSIFWPKLWFISRICVPSRHVSKNWRSFPRNWRLNIAVSTRWSRKLSNVWPKDGKNCNNFPRNDSKL